MPANKNAVTRYYILDQLLCNRYKNYTIEDLWKLVNEELANEYGMKPVSLRTIEYDIHYMHPGVGPFKAEIEHYTINAVSERSQKTEKRTCLRYADPSDSIFTRPLSDDERYLLGEAFTLLGQFDGLPNLDGLEKLRSSLNVKNPRQIISFTKNPLENSSLLGELFTVISQRQVIELHYHTFNNPEKILQINLHPYLLKEYNRRWYLIAAAENDEKLLNFALDRIDKVVALPTHHYIEYDGDLNERFEDIVGVSLYKDRPLQTIVFWVSDKSKDYVATKPIHESQRRHRGEKESLLRQRYPMLENGYFFSIDCIENYELIRELTSFGEDLIVLSPDNIKEKVIERITVTYNKYKILCK